MGWDKWVSLLNALLWILQRRPYWINIKNENGFGHAAVCSQHRFNFQVILQAVCTYGSFASPEKKTVCIESRWYCPGFCYRYLSQNGGFFFQKHFCVSVFARVGLCSAFSVRAELELRSFLVQTQQRVLCILTPGFRPGPKGSAELCVGLCPCCQSCWRCWGCGAGLPAAPGAALGSGSGSEAQRVVHGRAAEVKGREKWDLAFQTKACLVSVQGALTGDKVIRGSSRCKEHTHAVCSTLYAAFLWGVGAQLQSFLSSGDLLSAVILAGSADGDVTAWRLLLRQNGSLGWTLFSLVVQHELYFSLLFLRVWGLWAVEDISHRWPFV